MRKNKFGSVLIWLCTVAIVAALGLSCSGCGNSQEYERPSPTPDIVGGTEIPDDEQQTPETPSGGEDEKPENPSGGEDEKTENPSGGEDEKPETPSGGEDEKPEPPPAWAGNFDLPDADIAYGKLKEIYGGEEKIFLLQKGKIARMPCPQGEVIALNMLYEVGEYARLVFEDSVAEFNEIFAVINPNYRFEINYEPTDEELGKKYSVRMSVSDNLAVTETSRVFGLAHINYYAGFTELGDFGITIKSEVLNSGSYLMTTFKHELMHLLGAGDAYNNSSATKDTVMQSYRVSGYHFLSATDLAFLDALYRNPELEEKGDEIGEFISRYETETTHTKAALTAAVFRKTVDNLSPDTLLGQAASIGYADLSGFTAAVSGGIERDTDFGGSAVSFTELEYTVRPEATYFGSIDPQKGLYWHGRQTSLGSSQSYKFTDYGSGILYAAPNGNLYTVLIKVGDFVLAFDLSGGFTDFASFSLSLRNISK